MVSVGVWDTPSDVFLAGAIQRVARSRQVSLDEAENPVEGLGLRNMYRGVLLAV